MLPQLIQYLGLTFLVVGSLVRIFLAPPAPLAVFGTVQIDGEDVPDGTIVEAICGGVTQVETTTPDSEIGPSSYSFNVPGDDPDETGIDGCLTGETIVFKVDGLFADQTTTWSSGDFVELNLTAERPRPELVLRKKVNGLDTSSPPGLYILSGQMVTWTVTVTNTGNVHLADVGIEDDNGTPDNASDDFTICTITNLPPLVGNVAQCAWTGTAMDGQFVNTAVVTGTFETTVVSDTALAFYFGAVTTLDIEKKTNEVDADEPPGVYLFAGEPVTWTFAITNTGNITLTNVIATDDNGSPGVPGDDQEVCNVSVLGPAEIHICASKTSTVTLGQYGNNVSVSGTPPGGLPDVGDSDPSHYYGSVTGVAILKTTNGEEANEPTGPYIEVGETVNWQYTVSNTSNVTLTNVMVSDNLVAELSCPAEQLAELGPGQALVCTATGSADPEQYVNLGTAIGTPPGGLPVVSDTNPSHYFGAMPVIDVEKYTNGFDADAEPGPFILQGDPVTWTYYISNTGNVTLTSITLSDDERGAITCPQDTLVANELMVCTDVFTATVGQYGNLATVTGLPPGGLGVVSDEDPSHYFGSGPLIQVEKLTNDQDADTGTGPFILVGDTVTWTYIISNTGNVDLTNIMLTDSDRPLFDCTIPDLSPGEGFVCIDTDQAEKGPYENVATVEATPDGGLANIFDEDTSHYFGAEPLITIEKYTNGQDADSGTGPYILENDLVTWTYQITNSGNITLTILSVTDDQLPGLVCPTPILSVGQGFICEDSDQALSGQQENLATVTALPHGGLEAISNTDASHYFGASPVISLEKLTNGQDADSAPGPYILLGDAVNWSYQVANIGNVALTGVTVTDDNGTPADTGDDYTCIIGDLGSGVIDSTTCSQISEAQDGQRENLGSVEGAYTGTFATKVVSDDDLSHYFGAITTIDLEKHTNGQDADSGTGPFILVGQKVTWTYHLTNTGNVSVTLSNDGLVDDKQGIITCPESTLAPDQQMVCTETGTALPDQQSNVAIITADPMGALPSITDTDASRYFGAFTSIDLEKHTNDQDADEGTGPYILVGDRVTWTFHITNTGNVTLTIPENGLVDDVRGVITCEESILSAGEKITCTDSDDAIIDQHENQATVQANPDGGLPVVGDTDISHYFGSTTGIEIKKLTNNVAADSGTGPFILVGQDVTWTYIITNTGNVTLTNIIVTDDNGTPTFSNDDFDSGLLGPLQAGSQLVYEVVGVAKKDAYLNTGRVTAKPWVGQDVSESDTSRYFGADPTMTINKTTNDQDADLGQGPRIQEGEPVTWTYVVTNTGNVLLTNVVIWDDNGTPGNLSDDDDVCMVGSLAPGEVSEPCYRFGEAEVGQYANIGSAIGDAPVGPVVIAVDPSHYFGFAPNPSIDIRKWTNGQEADEPPGVYITFNDSVTWTYSVQNNGNVDLVEIIVMDDMGTPNNTDDDVEVCALDTLAQFEEHLCDPQTASAEAGLQVNLVLASGRYLTETVTDTDASYYFGVVAGMTLEKLTNGQKADQPPGPNLTLGEQVTWTYLLTNTGNITLTNIVITDDNGTPAFTPDDFDCQIAELGLSGPAMCLQTGLVISGQYSNTASATALPPVGILAPVSDVSHYRGFSFTFLPFILR